MLHKIGIILSATDKAVTEVTVVAHGLVAVVTHHDSLTEPEMDDDNVALKSLTIVPCLAAVTITPFQFHVKWRLFFIISIKILKKNDYYFFGFILWLVLF